MPIPLIEVSRIEQQKAFEESDTTCTICRATMKKVIMVACGHIFDEHCIKRWWRGETGTCPQCQREVSILSTDPKDIERTINKWVDLSSLQDACDHLRVDEPEEEEEVPSYPQEENREPAWVRNLFDMRAFQMGDLFNLPRNNRQIIVLQGRPMVVGLMGDVTWKECAFYVAALVLAVLLNPSFNKT